MAISRPYLDPAICTPIAARQLRFEDHTYEYVFWIRTDQPFAMQVVGDPARRANAPFAMLLRFPVPVGKLDAQRELIRIGDFEVGIMSPPNGQGNGDALFNLPDGGQGYLRSRDLTRQQMVAVIESLRPRPANAEIPGFDVDEHAESTLIAEHMNSGIAGALSSLSCRSREEPIRQYRVDAVDGEPVFEYLAILDRARPIGAGEINGTTIVIGHGLVSESAPRVDQVVNADQATWDALLAQPFP